MDTSPSCCLLPGPAQAAAEFSSEADGEDVLFEADSDDEATPRACTKSHTHNASVHTHNAGWPTKGPYRQKQCKNCRKTKKLKIKKPYIRLVWVSCLWDSDSWEEWERILEPIPPYYRDIWSHKTSDTLMFFLFSQHSHGDQQKATCLYITHIQYISLPYS